MLLLSDSKVIFLCKHPFTASDYKYRLLQSVNRFLTEFFEHSANSTGYICFSQNAAAIIGFILYSSLPFAAVFPDNNRRR